MNSFLLDVKKILLGEDDSENTPLDFKEELASSINNNIIDKAKATLLMTARSNVDKLGNDIDKKQAAGINGKGEKLLSKNAKKFQKEIEEFEISDEKDKKKRRDEEDERKKKEESLRQTMQRVAEEDEKNEFRDNIKHKRRINIIKKLKFKNSFFFI